MRTGFIHRLCVGLGPLLVCVAGCSSEMEMDGRMEMKMDGSMRIEGPIVMQMQGPTIRYDGTFVSKDIFEQIKPKETTVTWVLTIVGEPDRRAVLEDGTELLVWAYRLAGVEGAIVDVVSVGGGGDDSKKGPANVTTAVRIANGIVVEKWRG